MGAAGEIGGAGGSGLAETASVERAEGIASRHGRCRAGDGSQAGASSAVTSSLPAANRAGGRGASARWLGGRAGDPAQAVSPAPAHYSPTRHRPAPHGQRADRLPPGPGGLGHLGLSLGRGPAGRLVRLVAEHAACPSRPRARQGCSRRRHRGHQQPSSLAERMGRDHCPGRRRALGRPRQRRDVRVEIADLRMGVYEEYDATAELLGWLLTDVRHRVIDTRLDEPFLHEHLRRRVYWPRSRRRRNRAARA